MTVLISWRPKERNIVLQDKPDYVPDWVYTEACAAKSFYNRMWEFWVFEESRKYNVSQSLAEDACIRGLQKVLNQVKLVYGDKIGQWYTEFLEMGDIFNKIKHPEYLPKLG